MVKEKAVLCDSSVLISLMDSCFGDMFSLIEKKTGVYFYITPGVKLEIVSHPLSIQMKAYELSALRMKALIDKNVLEEINADTEELTKKLMQIGNNIFYARGKPIHLIDLGETDIIATASLLNIKTLLIDERTTRMLIEAPFQLKAHLEDELRTSVYVNQENFREFQKFVEDMHVIRSVELLGIAYKLGYFESFGKDKKKAIEAALYKAKYSGSAVRFDEIEAYVKLLTKA